MTVRDLIGEKLSDPAHNPEIALDIQINVLFPIISHPDERQGGIEADNQELEGEDGVQYFVHHSHQV